MSTFALHEHRIRLRSLAPYAELVRLAFRNTLHARGELIGRAAFYGLLLYVFSRLWIAVLPDQSLTGFSAVDGVWYLAFTEWIVLSLPLPHQQIAKDINDGSLATAMTRPTSYIWSQMAEAIGELFARMLAMLPAGMAFAWLFTGQWPSQVSVLPSLVPLALLAGLLGTLMHGLFGLLGAWLHEVTPLYWINNKLQMLAGGMILPLSIYPDLLHEIASWTPWYATLYGVGQHLVGAPGAAWLGSLAMLGAWLVVMVIVMELLWRRVQRIVCEKGG